MSFEIALKRALDAGNYTVQHSVKVVWDCVLLGIGSSVIDQVWAGIRVHVSPDTRACLKLDREVRVTHRRSRKSHDT